MTGQQRELVLQGVEIDRDVLAVAVANLADRTPRCVKMNKRQYGTHGQTMIEHLHAPFYLQRVQVSDRFQGVARLDAFRQYCEGKAVLHIGCAQFPITNPANNLHVQLAPFCRLLDGYDIAKDMYDVLRPHVHNGRFLPALRDAGQYDVVLIPEVLEHVSDVSGFLGAMSEIKTSRFIITVPDVFQCYQRHFAMDERQGVFFEAVHPDHNCWYSPYTIANTLRKYTDWLVEEICWFNRISLLVSATPRYHAVSDPYSEQHGSEGNSSRT